MSPCGENLVGIPRVPSTAHAPQGMHREMNRMVPCCCRGHSPARRRGSAAATPEARLWVVIAHARVAMITHAITSSCLHRDVVVPRWCSRAAGAYWTTADPAIDDVAKALGLLRAGRLVRRADGHLELSDMCWPYTTTKVLYVRECYNWMFESVLGQCRWVADSPSGEAVNRRIVTGQPGSGKTVWS